MNAYSYKLCDPSIDYDDLVDLLYTIRSELGLPNREACKVVIDLCFEKGGIVGSYDKEQLCGLVGFFYGDPNEAYVDKSIAFMYVAGGLEAYRLTRMFAQGLTFALYTFQSLGLHEFRLQASKTNAYTNKLYSRFATAAGEGKTLRGAPVINYVGNVDEALIYLIRGRKRRIVDVRANLITYP